MHGTYNIKTKPAEHRHNCDLCVRRLVCVRTVGMMVLATQTSALPPIVDSVDEASITWGSDIHTAVWSRGTYIENKVREIVCESMDWMLIT